MLEMAGILLDRQQSNYESHYFRLTYMFVHCESCFHPENVHSMSMNHQESTLTYTLNLAKTIHLKI